MQGMQLLDVERRLERIERLLRAAADEARSARTDLGHPDGPGERWARMMFAVLDEVDGLGGEVSRRRFLEIGERHGYSHRGMAGYYQQSWKRLRAIRRGSPRSVESGCCSSASATGKARDAFDR